MKVVIISSSPRKGGNSDVLCDQFAKGAAEAGHEAGKVNLRKKTVPLSGLLRLHGKPRLRHQGRYGGDLSQAGSCRSHGAGFAGVLLFLVQPNEDADRPLPCGSQGHCG